MLAITQSFVKTQFRSSGTEVCTSRVHLYRTLYFHYHQAEKGCEIVCLDYYPCRALPCYYYKACCRSLQLACKLALVYSTRYTEEHCCPSGLYKIGRAHV